MGPWPQAMNEFRRMLVTHTAREQSVAFPAFPEIVPSDLCLELGRQFKRRKRSTLGGEGLTQVLRQVASGNGNYEKRRCAQHTLPVASRPQKQECHTYGGRRGTRDRIINYQSSLINHFAALYLAQ